MRRRYSRHSRNDGVSVPSWVFVSWLAVIAFGLGLGGVVEWQKARSEEADRAQLSPLQLEHSRAVLARAEARSEAERERANARVIELTGRHNAILLRHPTWAVKPLSADDDGERPGRRQ